jgi:hypothetical protein
MFCIEDALNEAPVATTVCGVKAVWLPGDEVGEGEEGSAEVTVEPHAEG